ncbi:hypothetical protein F4677DRAFT_425729 [Hypoxylon crocopeplum]|nr:hypothetical protein F4677DRAFT_425729 [Hypoxylon crocopeplum]
MGCGDSGYPFCTEPGVPDDFCCREATNCILLAGNTTVICCDKTFTESCYTIATISCDLPLIAFPSDFQTTVREGNLPACGDACCPWGYHCNSDGACEMDDDQNKPPPGVESSSSKRRSKTSSTTQTTEAKTSTSSSTSTSTSDTSVTPSTSSKATSSSATTTSSATSEASEITTTIVVAISSETPSSTMFIAPALEGDQTANGSSSTISKGAVAGIAVGAVSGVALLLLVLYLISRVRRSMQARKDEQAAANPQDSQIIVESKASDPLANDTPIEKPQIHELPG